MTILFSITRLSAKYQVLGNFSVTLKDEAEWAELVSSGWNRLAGSVAELISDLIESFPAVAERPSFYGDGNAGKEIVNSLRF